MVNGICRLCDEETSLKHSHIFPKFIFNWIKKNRSGYLRSGEDINVRRQDGFKSYILCAKCEDRFSKLETYFSHKIFHPVVSGELDDFQYDERFFRFAISVIWRILHYDMLEGEKGYFSYPFLQAAEREWRDYLLDSNKPINFNKIHLFVGVGVSDDNSDVEVPSKFVQYMEGAADSWCSDNEKSFCIVFLKIPKFLFIIPLSGFDESQLEKTEVFIEGGRYDVNSAAIWDPNVSGILLNRVNQVESVLAKMSVNQQRTILKSIEDNRESFDNKYFGEIIDYVDKKSRRK